MDIQFRCTNILNFDKASGQYQHCDQLMEASDEHVGLKVRCPKCEQLNVVPGPAMVGTATDLASEEVSAEVANDPFPPVSDAASTPVLNYTQFDKKTRCHKCGSLLDNEGKCTACYLFLRR